MGADIRMGVRVEKYDENKPSVILASGKEICGDIIIGADGTVTDFLTDLIKGVKSAARTAVLGYEDKPKSSGYAVYRAFFPADRLKDDPALNHFTKKDYINVWIGPDMHGFVTSLRNGKEINWVLTHKDEANIDEGWAIPGNMEDVKELLKGWDPIFQKVVDKCDECIDWKLVYRDPLPTVFQIVKFINDIVGVEVG